MSITDRMENDGMTYKDAKMKESLTVGDKINPSHYRSHPSGVECIVITRHMTLNVGNAIKYLWRAGLKDSSPQIEDLKKARWYLDDEIKKLETR